MLDRLARLLVAGVTISAALGAHSARREAAPPLRVELWGDSMGMQSAPAFTFLMGLSGNGVTQSHTFPGTAICDWLTDIRRELDPANPAGFHPQAAVFVFSGVTYTPCMRGPNGAELTGQALIKRYEADAAQAIALFTKANVPVYFASVPISRDNAAAGAVGDTLLGDMYARLPARYPGGVVRFIDSALAVERNGHYTDTLPCQEGEVCTGHAPDGTPTVVVREADGKHFCPVAEVPTGDTFGFTACPVVMPGALRFMGAITTRVLHDFELK
ncbi:MAG TPA: hypothetical protein VHX15_16600 [Frankiaceae bacterium]|nr:hypothetical protein [Frankiaceae bacterium]